MQSTAKNVLNESSSDPSVAILVPTLNEADNIDLLFRRLLPELDRISSYTEILVVDGGSTDGTQEKVSSWSIAAPVRLVQSEGGRGLAGDILFGAEQTNAEVVVVMDADLSHPPKALPDLVRPVLQGSHDMAVGSRYVPGGETPGWPWRRKAASLAATALAWPLVSARDPMSGFFAVGRRHLLDLSQNASGFKIALEIMARADDRLRVAEVPISFVDREHGQSKLGFAVITTYLKQLVALAGGAVPTESTIKFALVGLLGMGVDALIFNLLLFFGADLVIAHLSSFVVATIFNYAFNARWAFKTTADGTEALYWRYLRYLLVCVLAFFLRGSVLSALVEVAGWSPQSAIFAAIASAALVNFTGSAFFIFPSSSVYATPGLRWRLLAGALILYALVLRVLFAGLIDLIPEEAYYWNYARHLDIGYFDHPPMVAWLIWISTSLFGHTEFAVRLPAILCGLGTLAFSYRLTENIFGKTSAFATGAVVALLPIYFFTGMLMTPDAPLFAAWAGTLYFLHRSLAQGRCGSWYGAGILLGLGMLSKYTIALLAPATFLFILIDRRSHHWLLRPQPYIAAIIAAVLFSPVILWNVNHHWASFAFQGPQRWSKIPEFALHELLGTFLIQLTPVGLVVLLGAFFLNKNSDTYLGNRLFAAVFTFAPMMVFVLHSLQGSPRLNWTGPLWLAALPLMASVLTTTGRTSFPVWTRWAISASKPTFVGLAFLFGGFMYWVQIGLPGLHPDRNMSLPVAWEELQRMIDDVEDVLEAKTGQKPLIVGLDKYFLASQLAFYTAKTGGDDQTAGRNLLGEESLMWKTWMPSTAMIGKDVILVDFDSKDLANASLGKHFHEMGHLETRKIRKNNHNVGQIYYRIGYGYRG